MNKINVNDFLDFDINIFSRNINKSRVMALLDDNDDLDSFEKEKICNYKESIIKEEVLDLNNENVLGDIDLILINMPNNLNPIEKVRWVYINLGKIFSYDYRVSDDIRYGKDKVINPYVYIGRYQTCIQISEIVNLLLNQIDGVTSKTIERKLNGVNSLYGDNHVANEIKVRVGNNIETYLLDLTLDLFLIQSGCKTMHFAYESGLNGEYDIIPQIDNYYMDKKLGLIVDNYTDKKIDEVKEIIRSKNYNDMSSKERIEDKIINIYSLIKTFEGYHEGKRYVSMLFDELLHEKYREFNISSKTDDYTNLKTCYMIECSDYIKWIIYSNKIGFLSTNEERLQKMLDKNWNTKSTTLKKLVLKK